MAEIPEAYVFDALRTPRGRGKASGSLYEVKPVSLVVGLIDEMRARHPELDTDQIDDVVLGVVSPIGDQGGDIAKTAAIAAGLPHTVAGVRPCTTVTLAPRKCAASRAGSDRRAHNGCWLLGRSRCLPRRRSSSGTSKPPADATVAEPPAAITACAASTVVRARLPPASDGTI